MDEGAVNQFIVQPETYLVQSMGNVSVPVIDYGRIQVPQFVHPVPFYSRVPVQYADIDSNPPLGQPYPVELEMQSHFQDSEEPVQSWISQSTGSGINASTQTVEEWEEEEQGGEEEEEGKEGQEYVYVEDGEEGREEQEYVYVDDSPNPTEMPNVMPDGSFMSFPTVPNISEGIVNIDGLTVQNNVFYQPYIKQVIVDRGQYFILPQPQIIFNNVFTQNYGTGVLEPDEQSRRIEEEEEDGGEAETEAVSFSELNEYVNTGDQGMDSYFSSNEQGYNTDEVEGEMYEEEDDDEQQGEIEAAWNPGVNIVYGNFIEEAVPPTGLNTCDSYNQMESTISELETDENTVPSVYEFDIDDPPIPDNAPKMGSDKKRQLGQKIHSCHVCNRKFGQRKNLYFHLRKLHNVQPVIEGGIFCPVCKEASRKRECLRKHLERSHGIEMQKEEKSFSTFNDFLEWKTQVEKETFSSYISKSSLKVLSNNEQKRYYTCHRSGSYATLTVRKKRLKDNGSVKMGATCPAAIEVTENKTGISVVFWKTHVGHSQELSRLPLSKEDRAQILEYLNCGLRSNEIVRHFRSMSSGNTPTKLSLLTKHDVRNVKKCYELASNPDGPRPMQEKMLNVPSQRAIIEKANILWQLLETTTVKVEFRTKVCLMLDNLICLMKRQNEKVCRIQPIPDQRTVWLGRLGPDLVDQIDDENDMKSETPLDYQRN